MQEPIIQFDQVSRRFGGRDVLKNIDLQVPGGIIAGLVGPNGSGKTTLLKLMAGFIKTTSGDVRLFGYDPFVQRAEVMRRARFAFAPPAVYGSLSAWEHLKFLSATGMPPHERPTHSEIWAALETVGLAARAKDKARTYSFGMKQRLGLAQALLPMPSLLVFDEPTDGLDPIAVVELRDLLKGLQTEHKLTIVWKEPFGGDFRTAGPVASPYDRFGTNTQRFGGLLSITRQTARVFNEHPCGSLFGETAQWAHWPGYGCIDGPISRSLENSGR